MSYIDEILQITPLISNIFQCNYVLDKQSAVYLYLYNLDKDKANEYINNLNEKDLYYTVWDRNIVKRLSFIEAYEYSGEETSTYIFTNYRTGRKIILTLGKEEKIYVLDIQHQQVQILGIDTLFNKYNNISGFLPLKKLSLEALAYIRTNRKNFTESLKEVMECSVKEYRYKGNRVDQRIDNVRTDNVRIEETKEKKSGCT